MTSSVAVDQVRPFDISTETSDKIKAIAKNYREKRGGSVTNSPGELYHNEGLTSDRERIAAAKFLVEELKLPYRQLGRGIRASLDYHADGNVPYGELESLGCFVRAIPGYKRLRKIS